MTESAPSGFDKDGPLRTPGTRAVRPRPAATLVLVDGTGTQPRLLLGRRSGGHDFMPHKWVFPGGRVERSDHAAPAASELARSEAEAVLRLRGARRSPPSLARALALAAVRETFEEAGLLLAAPAAVRGGGGAWDGFVRRGLAADLACMSFIGRAVTPANRPKRFDASFFMAAADRLYGGSAPQQSRELDEVGWFSSGEIERMDLPTVTRVLAVEALRRVAEPGRAPLLLLPSNAFGRTGAAGAAPQSL